MAATNFLTENFKANDSSLINDLVFNQHQIQPTAIIPPAIQHQIPPASPTTTTSEPQIITTTHPYVIPTTTIVCTAATIIPGNGLVEIGSPNIDNTNTDTENCNLSIAECVENSSGEGSDSDTEEEVGSNCEDDHLSIDYIS